jgi:hypothetical protein
MHTNDDKQLNYEVKVPSRKFVLYSVLKIGKGVYCPTFVIITASLPGNINPSIIRNEQIAFMQLPSFRDNPSQWTY